MATTHEQFYLDQIKKGTTNDATIRERFRRKFPKVDVSKVRKSLLDSGKIVLVNKHQTSHRTYSFYDIPRQDVKQSRIWEDGTPKSFGNAFDWRNFAKGIATLENRLVPNLNNSNSITIYTKARRS